MSVLDFQRKVADIQPSTFANNQATLNHISQLTDIPFPRLLFQRFQKAGVISLMAYESFSEKLLAKAVARILISPVRSRSEGRCT